MQVFTQCLAAFAFRGQDGCRGVQEQGCLVPFVATPS